MLDTNRHHYCAYDLRMKRRQSNKKKSARLNAFTALLLTHSLTHSTNITQALSCFPPTAVAVVVMRGVCAHASGKIHALTIHGSSRRQMGGYSTAVAVSIIGTPLLGRHYRAARDVQTTIMSMLDGSDRAQSRPVGRERARVSCSTYTYNNARKKAFASATCARAAAACMHICWVKRGTTR